ncbi:hypothetical protein CMUS01_13391 [Colletotrichum musicola]|uniref:Uncharacterized protein n=1 Tax=Colletotrichum musicola TaxID=2175873 RepID=A0A8H6JDR2_9PEZI|nr:hypothetical protein CMUS01_13391 [Colletotrichum musicola]
MDSSAVEMDRIVVEILEMFRLSIVKKGCVAVRVVCITVVKVKVRAGIVDVIGQVSRGFIMADSSPTDDLHVAIAVVVHLHLSAPELVRHGRQKQNELESKGETSRIAAWHHSGGMLGWSASVTDRPTKVAGVL